MRLGSARADVVHTSAVTWAAVAAVALLLAGLSFVLIGCAGIIGIDDWQPCSEGQVSVGETCTNSAVNNYVCGCTCTIPLANGARVSVVPAETLVFDGPSLAATGIGVQSQGSAGTVTGGPVVDTAGGETNTWWQVDFDDGQDGWVLEQDIAADDVKKDLDVCIPAAFNPNVTNDPPVFHPDVDCVDRVQPHVADLLQPNLAAGANCTCQAQEVVSVWDTTCDAPCTDTTGVCLVAQSDPPDPTPDPLSTSLFGATSICEVAGTAEVQVGEETARTTVRGIVRIHGRPCAQGEACQVGISYQVTFDPIVLQALHNHRFSEIGLSGASEPQAVRITPRGRTLFGGRVPIGATVNSARGIVANNNGAANSIVMVGKNDEPLNFEIDWANKHCLLSGAVAGGIIDDDRNTQSVRIAMTVGGPTDSLSQIVNQPPRANAGRDQTVECTAPQTSVNLSAAGTTDGDGNIASYVWRRGSVTGALVAPPSAKPIITTRQGIGETTYHLRAIDSRLAADTDFVTVNVVDTTAPTISCNAPETITPPARPISFAATAADACDPNPGVIVENVQCLRANRSCGATLQGNAVTITSAGAGDVIRWRVRSTDAAGNRAQTTCEVRVITPARQ